jgi:hypothetical protein
MALINKLALRLRRALAHNHHRQLGPAETFALPHLMTLQAVTCAALHRAALPPVPTLPTTACVRTPFADDMKRPSARSGALTTREGLHGTHSDGLPVGDDGDGIGCSSTAHVRRLAAAPRGIRPWADEGRPARTVDVQLLQKS